jgi:hypothetical protein
MMMVSNSFNFPPNGYYNPQPYLRANTPQVPVGNFEYNQLSYNPSAYAGGSGYPPNIPYGQPVYNLQPYNQGGQYPLLNNQSFAYQQPINSGYFVPTNRQQPPSIFYNQSAYGNGFHLLQPYQTPQPIAYSQVPNSNNSSAWIQPPAKPPAYPVAYEPLPTPPLTAKTAAKTLINNFGSFESLLDTDKNRKDNIAQFNELVEYTKKADAQPDVKKAAQFFINNRSTTFNKMENLNDPSGKLDGIFSLDELRKFEQTL